MAEETTEAKAKTPRKATNRAKRATAEEIAARAKARADAIHQVADARIEAKKKLADAKVEADRQAAANKQAAAKEGKSTSARDFGRQVVTPIGSSHPKASGTPDDQLDVLGMLIILMFLELVRDATSGNRMKKTLSDLGKTLTPGSKTADADFVALRKDMLPVLTWIVAALFLVWLASVAPTFAKSITGLVLIGVVLKNADSYVKLLEKSQKIVTG